MKDIDEYIQEAYEELVKFTANQEVREEYEAREKALRDRYSFLIDAKRRGMAEGRAEGISLVKEMLRLQRVGKSIEEIAIECKVSIDEVRDVLE